MAKIEGQILIGRPVEEVFDFVADSRNEPQYNPAMTSVELLTALPVGRGHGSAHAWAGRARRCWWS
jgi:uncharacterized membrane protein